MGSMHSHVRVCVQFFKYDSSLFSPVLFVLLFLSAAALNIVIPYPV